MARTGITNQKEITELIKRISGQANILAIPRIYIDLLDSDINTAIVLSQLVYWSDRGGKNGWIYKSFREWTEETSLSQYQVARCVDKLKALNIIETDVRLANAAPTTHYRVDMETLTNTIIKFLNNGLSRNLTMDYEETSQSDYEETSQSLTETTKDYTETTATAAVYKKFENEIGVISYAITREIDLAIDTYQTDWIIDAIDEAAKNNVRKWSYVSAILKRWRESGRNNNGRGKRQTEKPYIPEDHATEVYQ